ncbi:DUF1707 and DUF2154 domain-containing protein [Corynebacterium sp. CCUG 71335]|uniref:DUF1707 SHOCT-like domain-containing protein n=1 Tax=Corynebacterium sp. CCUG 71335 TaxID=2823892 RepID=UPI00210885EE|nr:DUF1707 domain-containing protein [Corynebacterium sp. CCUG 71335]MCQ4620650.1 DUF1707 and DUF2154 domain-containing protein [Corynebacterium sp. CCUG 71335]
MSTDSADNFPRKRVSHARRQEIADVLAAAFADGQLNTTEFDERTAVVWRATYADQLDELTVDLSPVQQLPDTAGWSPAPHQPRSKALDFVTAEPGGTSSSIAVMGGVERSGDWLVSKNHFSLGLMGETELNLLQARLASDHIRISANAIMGGITIVVPEDVRVKSEGFALMGGFGVTDHPSVTIAQRDLPDDAPTVTIAGIALMGGVDVVRAARGAKV